MRNRKKGDFENFVIGQDLEKDHFLSNKVLERKKPCADLLATEGEKDLGMSNIGKVKPTKAVSLLRWSVKDKKKRNAIRTESERRETLHNTRL